MTDPTRESHFHYALIALGIVKPTNQRSERDLQNALEEYGTLEDVFVNLTLGEKIIDTVPRLERVIEETQNVSPDFTVLYRRNHPELWARMGELAPPVLYAQGNIDLLTQPSIAVVGTRDLDRQYRPEAHHIMERLLKNKLIIVSGLAEGSDTLAHRYALDHHGQTVAVLGTPLSKQYPAANRVLQNDIAKKGCVVSQYPVGLNTRGYHFAYRNRVTAGLASEGVVVISALDDSGTEHTIRHGHTLKRPLYALPHNRSARWFDRYDAKQLDNKSEHP